MDRNKGNGFLQEVEELLNDIMGEDPAGCPLGTLALRDILQRHGGVDIYIPCLTERYRAWRDEQIRVEFQGDNYGELALRWDLEERWIREIVDGKKEE